jgi:hypothetical protein
MSDAWSKLPGSSGDAWTRMCGDSGDAWARLAGTIGDAWERLIAACGAAQAIRRLLDTVANLFATFNPFSQQNVAARSSLNAAAHVSPTVSQSITLKTELESHPVVHATAVDAPDLVSKGGP